MPVFATKTLNSLSLLLGVTLISFLLMVYFGPDRSYLIAGKNPNPAELEQIREQLDYNKPIAQRYLNYLKDLATFNLGNSQSTGKPVAKILSSALPVSVLLLLPGFIAGNLIALILAMITAWYRHKWPDRLLTSLSLVGISISFLIVIIALSTWLCTPQGLNLFPSRGWHVTDVGSWFKYATVPSLALIFVTVFFNLRFYRALFLDEMEQDYIRTAKSYGATPVGIMFKEALPNTLVPILTRFLFSLPAILISGSLLLESYFGIPGIGKVGFDAIFNADQPVLNALVALSAIAVIFISWLADFIYPGLDPRIVINDHNSGAI